MYENELSTLLKKHITLFRVVFLLLDMVLLNVAFQLAFFGRFSGFLFEAPFTIEGIPVSIYYNLELYMSIMWTVVAVSTGLYVGRRGHPRYEEIRDLLKALGFLATAILLYIVAQGGYNFYSRRFLIYFFGTASVMMLGFRIALRSSLALARTRGINRKDILIIGAGRAGQRFYNTVTSNPGYGYRVLGFLDDNGINSKVRSMIMGKLHDLDRITETQPVDEIVIALPKATEETIAELVTACESKCIRVNVIPNDYAAFEGKRVIEQIGEFSLVRMREAPLDLPTSKFIKRSFDVIFSIFALVFVFPIVFVVAGLLIKLTSRGPVFFKQLRTGEDGTSFTCYKFRTMRDMPRMVADTLQARPNDPRLTAVGRFLRRTNLDELPQFWNVLKGEMSVVGPRPHMLKHTEDYRQLISQYMVRHFVKPGLTGWAQVNGLRGATESPLLMERRIEHDVYYIENWSFLFDLSIIGKTVGTMLKGDKNAY
jgi:putative colanic acid biosysnthesis UDP-glucose lipid carrier transferase